MPEGEENPPICFCIFVINIATPSSELSLYKWDQDQSPPCILMHAVATNSFEPIQLLDKWNLK